MTDLNLSKTPRMVTPRLPRGSLERRSTWVRTIISTLRFSSAIAWWKFYGFIFACILQAAIVVAVMPDLDKSTFREVYTRGIGLLIIHAGLYIYTLHNYFYENTFHKHLALHCPLILLLILF